MSRTAGSDLMKRKEHHMPTITPPLVRRRPGAGDRVLRLDLRRRRGRGEQRLPDGSLLGATFALPASASRVSTAAPATRTPTRSRSSSRVTGQDEVDHYWDALLAGGGRPTACGWLDDRFGWLAGHPRGAHGRAVATPTPRRRTTPMQAMLKQQKIVISELTGLGRVPRDPQVDPEARPIGGPDERRPLGSGSARGRASRGRRPDARTRAPPATTARRRRSTPSPRRRRAGARDPIAAATSP